ncbi:MAG: AAA family ATPase [Byssovorax sp.]
MFTSIEIENFRGFSKLKLSDLGRVNLVVGKNNTGKTSLLEAIAIATGRDMMDLLPALFRIAAEKEDERYYPWLIKDGAARALIAATLDSGPNVRVVIAPAPLSARGSRSDWGRWIVLTVVNGLSDMLKTLAISVEHVPMEVLVVPFADAIRAPADERTMEALLASVDPRIKAVRLDVIGNRTFVAIDVGLTNRIPLPHLGQGIYRLVAIFSQLIGTKPKICFIDEIENGIHYTALPAVWKGIAEVAERLDIQIFATTHSRECLVAAHEVFSARPTYDFRIIQLDRVPGGVEGRTMGRDLIEAAIEADIEVR